MPARFLASVFAVTLATEILVHAVAPIAHPRFAQSRYVAFGYERADGFLPEYDIRKTLDVLANEREALKAMETQFKAWGRYTIVERPEQADLLVAVRTQQRAAVVVGKRPPPRVQDSRLSIGAEYDAPALGVEYDSASDMLVVYQAVDGRPASVLWREQLRDGLGGSAPLFEQLRAAVDALGKP